MEEVLRDIQILASDTEEFALVVSDLLGIFRVIKNYYIKEGPTSKVLKTILRKHVKGLYNEFTVLLKLYAGKSTKKLYDSDDKSCNETSDSDNYSIGESDKKSEGRNRKRRFASYNHRIKQPCDNTSASHYSAELNDQKSSKGRNRKFSFDTSDSEKFQ